MKLLAEAAADIKLSQAHARFYSKVMSNGQVFKKWTRDESPGIDEIVLAFVYEMQRPRIRMEIFRRLVQLYNVQLAQQNWVTANELLRKKVA